MSENVSESHVLTDEGYVKILLVWILGAAYTVAPCCSYEKEDNTFAGFITNSFQRTG